MIQQGKAGGGTISTIELAKTLNAVAQEKGIISAQADISIGIHKQFLKTTFDAKTNKNLNRRLIYAIEEIKKGNVPKGLGKWLESWKDPLALKVEQESRNILHVRNQLAHRHRAELFSGTTLKTNYIAFRNKMMSATTSQGFRFGEYGTSYKNIFLAAEKRAGVKLADTVGGLPKGLGRYAMLLAGGAAAGYLIYKSAGISGKDDDYNTIEALQHGWFGESRKYITDFGSGYQGALSSPHIDPTPTDWQGLGTTGATIGAAGYLWNSQINILGKTLDVSNLSYLGVEPEFLGRTKATYKDFIYNIVRRSELALGGVPKAFSISTLMSPSILRDAKFELDLGTKPLDIAADRLKKSKTSTKLRGVGYGYEEYLMQLTGKTKKTFGLGEGASFRKFEKVVFDKGKLFGVTGLGEKSLLLQEARLIKRIHDKNITGSAAQFAKSYESIFNIAGVGKEHEYLIAGGQTKRQALFRTAHAYAHETVSKYLRLVDDPAKAFRELFPNIKTSQGKVGRFISAATQMIPGFGVGGRTLKDRERRLVGSLPKILGRHARTALPLLIGLPAIFGTANWLVRQMSPEDSVAGQAGITGILAESARLAHMTYARVSEATGFTDLRRETEERAPGLTGFKPWLGFALSGVLTGTAAGMGMGILEELKAPAGKARYEAMVRAKTIKEAMPEGLRHLPAMSDRYTRAIRWGKRAGLAAGVLAAPFLLFGLGSKKTVEELDAEYLGGKEVAIKKARWWEFGMTPWEGERTDYYRPNWYNRLLDRPTDKSIYEGEDISPAGKFIRTLADPYWLEKMHYEDRPYPIAGSSGYEWTIGRVLKPPMYMHPEAFGGKKYRGDSGEYAPSLELGGLEAEEAITPYSAAEQMKQQYYSTYEAAGLRGFVTSSIKSAITGEQELFEHTPVLQSSADIDSTRRRFWDMNLGGLLGMTEPYRRFVPKRTYSTEYVNPLENTMPSWMPGEDYFKDFKTGDPYTKVPEGEYRLPGRGYEARYNELEGIHPEEYPLIHRYKILADVAPYSKEYKAAKRELKKEELSEYEQGIFNETERQVEERKTKRQFRDEVYDQSILGRYGATLVDIARANPLEQLTPIAPAHKLLPPGEALDRYKESIYGRDFKLWQRPIDDFVKPFMTTAGNLLGIDRIPGQVEEARKIEQYFDRLEYVKRERLGGDTRGTLTGADPYDNEHRLKRVLPKRERAYYQEFLDAEPEDRERLLEVMPEAVRDIYIAQWDKALLKQAQEGELQLEVDEKRNLEIEIFNRMATIRARRQAEAQEVLESESLPGDDWIGWRSDVDLEDIKMKYLIQTGRDFHYYDLWDDRLRALRRKPYLDDAIEEVDPFGELEPELTYEEVYRQAVQNGIKNPQIIQRSDSGGRMNYDLEYNRDQELRDELRAMGAIL
jgi:hypothetical protein